MERIDAREHWTQKKHWPIISRFVGIAGIREHLPTRNYQSNCRFYVDELNKIGLAQNRISAVKYLNECYAEGYTKDINFSDNQVNMYKRRHHSPSFMTYE